MPTYRAKPRTVQAWRVIHLVEGLEGGFKLPPPIQGAMLDNTLSMGRDSEDRPYVMMVSGCGQRLLIDEEQDLVVCDDDTLIPYTAEDFAKDFEPYP